MMIRMEKVSFQYEVGGGRVSEIDLSVKPGECLVITGASGSGKTTVLRLLNGLAPGYYPGTLSGTIRIEGKDSREIPFWEKGKQVGTVFQDPQSQFFSSQLPGEIAFGCENYGFERTEVISRTENAIETFGLSKFRHRPLDVLSAGEKQRIAIASVHAMAPALYVCDEPTANLDEEAALKLSETLKKLKAQKHTLVIAEHRLSWLREVADRYVCMAEGKILWERSREQMENMTGEETAFYGLRSFLTVERPFLPMPQRQKIPILEAVNISFEKKKKTLLRNFSLSVHPGEIIAITGHNGAGKTTLATILSGLKKESGGYLCIEGRKISLKERRKRIWYSANDTGSQFFTDSVAEEIFLYRKVSEQQKEEAGEVLKLLGLYALKQAHPATLSGGQKQRLSIACGLLSGREILIFDEPTSGLDGYNVRILSKVFCRAAKKNKAILIITHDNELIKGCCTHLTELG